MKQQDLEQFVRDTFRDHEHLVRGRAEPVLSVVRVRARRRRKMTRAGGAMLATVMVLGGAAIASQILVDAQLPSPGEIPSDWRLESSHGVEIAVPDHWSTNDYGCGMTSNPSVVRGERNAFNCLTEEPVSKELAFIGGDGHEPSPEQRLAARDVLISGLPAQRVEWTRSDGRFAGWILVPSQQIEILVRTLDSATTRNILDSTRVVDIDHAGCASKRPPRTASSAPGSPTFVMQTPASVSICHYGGMPDNTPNGVWLAASTEVRADDATRLADAINAAPAGRNPDAEGGCEGSPPAPDIVLHFHSSDNATQTLWITYSSCTERGVDNGASHAHITHTMLTLIRDAVHQGYAIRGRNTIPQ